MCMDSFFLNTKNFIYGKMKLQQERIFMKRFLIAFLVASQAMLLLSGCGDKNKKDAAEEIKVHAEKSELEDGCIYIRHKDGTFDQVYPGENDNSKKTGVFWFKSDFKKVPHLVQGAGDTLVYYSSGDLSYKFKFQRYYDLGYTVGICGLTPDKHTGRYSISTDKDDENTYPGSNADEILNTVNKNKTAIIDSIGGKELIRKVDDSTDQTSVDDSSGASDDDDINTENTDEEEQNRDKVSSDMVTRYGTIKNLQKGSLYTVLTYNGSVRKSINLRANVRAMGFAGEYASRGYKYGQGKDANLITIGIPDWFNTGYYTIQTDKTSVGMFALVNGSSYNESTDFNNPNQVPDTDEEKAMTDADDEENTTNPEAFDGYWDDISFNKSGYATVTLTFDNITDDEVTQIEGFKAGFFNNETNVTDFANPSPGVYVVKVDVTEGTNYKIGYSGLPASLSNPKRVIINYTIDD